MELLATVLAIVMSVACVITGYNKKPITKINFVNTVLIMIIGCVDQAERLAVYQGLSLFIVFMGLFIVVWICCYIVNKLCWFIGRIVRWMVD